MPLKAAATATLEATDGVVMVIVSPLTNAVVTGP